MKIIAFASVLVATCGIFSLSALAADPSQGEKIFQELRCTKCHHPEQKINGPALKIIAGTYGSKDKLMSFIKGVSEPIVEPERARTMIPRRRQIKKLSDSDQQALADFIMSFK